MVTWSVACVWVSSGEVAVAGVEEVGVMMVVVGILDVSTPPVTQVVFADLWGSHEKKRNHEVRWY